MVIAAIIEYYTNPRKLPVERALSALQVGKNDERFLKSASWPGRPKATTRRTAGQHAQLRTLLHGSADG